MDWRLGRQSHSTHTPRLLHVTSPAACTGGMQRLSLSSSQYTRRDMAAGVERPRLGSVEKCDLSSWKLGITRNSRSSFPRSCWDRVSITDFTVRSALLCSALLCSGAMLASTSLTHLQFISLV